MVEYSGGPVFSLNASSNPWLADMVRRLRIYTKNNNNNNDDNNEDDDDDEGTGPS